MPCPNALRNLSICLLTTLAVLTISTKSRAFQTPSSRVEVVPEGTEWLLGHQGDLSGGVTAPLREELAAQLGGGRWFQRLSGPHGGFRSIWGEGVDFGSEVTDDSQAALAAAERFWQDSAHLLPRGLAAEQLIPVANSENRGVRIVTHLQTMDGVPVLGTANYLVFVAGRLVLIGVRDLPAADIDGTPLVDVAQAAQTARDMIGAFGIQATAGDVSLAVLPSVVDDSIGFRLVHAVELKTALGRFTAYIDARTGEAYALRDERLFLDGTVELRVHERHPMSDLIEVPAAHMALSAGSDDTHTDADGAFSATGDPLDVLAFLSGWYVDVNNQAGSDLLLDTTIGDGETILWTDDTEFGQAQLDAYHFVIQARAHIRELVDDMVWLDSTTVANTNVYDMDGDTAPDYCNAWSDGETINFLQAGGSWGCTNTAQNGDIVHHEWGHSFHIQSVYMGSFVFDDAASEGFADSTAVMLSHDHVVAPYFTEGGYSIRDVEPDKVWPNDQASDPHETGLIVGGALWDLRKALVEEHGDPAGHEVLDEIFVQIVRLTSDIPSIYEATLVADDDNGNLVDGTPNFCTIYDAYDLHGLISGAFGRIVINHEQLGELEQPAAPIAVDAEVFVGEEDCNTLGDVRVVYSLDEGDSWEQVAMENQGGDAFHADIPAQPEGSEILYRIEADELQSGDVIQRPNNDAEPYYKAYVGPLDEIFCDDFEDDDGGWTHQLIYGVQREGADDWMWGTPKGSGGDPDGCYSGNYCWGNDLTPEEQWNGQYQPDKINRATSPAFDLSEYDHVRLQFRRWLQVEDGFYDHSRIYVITGEGADEVETLVWDNYASPGSGTDPHTTHHLDLEWILFDLDVTEQAAGQPAVRFAFEIQSDGGLQYGGWTFDDFCLYSKGEVPVDDPDAGPDDDGGPLMSSPTPASGCGCDTAGKSTDTGLLGLLLSVL